MKFAYFDHSGAVESVHNDETVTVLPPSAYAIDDAQWANRANLQLQSGAVVIASISISEDDLVALLSRRVQAHLDNEARTRNYDGILSLCSYATSTNPKFAAEGQAGVEWRDSVWATCYAIMADVKARTRQAPTEIELISELPAMVWPQ